ncbi:unnamed protein product [Caenorhabditis bovis]|uniref:tRNA/rRNA methyltransferase SpoU type domain-containing protein n=1 Tax=Caenorhabditis bovis TaxID=2654633 RepID=A0A8S1EUH5_9PELO|nr:unnamed protein product [Caenorhabditis bovis]
MSEEVDGTEILDEASQRHHFVKLVDEIKTEEQVTNFLNDIFDLDHHALGPALPSLCLLSALSISEKERLRLEKICCQVLLDVDTSRGDRRAAVACLKEFHKEPAWMDFYVLAEGIEEPQFHIIRPILPRMDSLLEAVKAGTISFDYAKIVLIRAFVHSNGWIRSWAIEKVIEIDSKILANNYEFIPDYVMPYVNNNDVFWRILEKNEMNEFLHKFALMIENVKSALETDDLKIDFLKTLLLAMESISCPTAMFFCSTIFNEISITPLFNYEKCTLFRRVVLRARYIPHKSLRIVTIRNLIVFFVKISIIDNVILREISKLLNFISKEATGEFMDNTFAKIDQIFKEAQYRPEKVEDFVKKFDEYGSLDLANYARLWWITLTNDPEAQEQLVKRIETEMTSVLRVQDREGNRQFEDLLFLIAQKPEHIKFNLDYMELCKEVALRVSRAKGVFEEMEILKSLFGPFLARYGRGSWKSLLDVPYCMFKFPLNPTITLAYFLTFFEIFLPRGDDANDFDLDFIEFLGADPIGIPSPRPADKDYEKDWNKLAIEYHALRLDLFLRCMSPSKLKNDIILRECVEQLDIASTFPIKEKLCNVMAIYIAKTTDLLLVLSCIRACVNIVTEEKKSSNNLPAIRCLVRVALSARLGVEATHEIIKIFEAQLLIASQNVQVALILIQGLEENFENISPLWARFVVKIALFGPVPKKETRVLTFGYSKVFNEEVGLENDDLERLDEVVQKARFTAVVFCVKKAEVCEEWATQIAERLMETSKLNDQSSSRSFGLSMAHRQKTRAVELLHLVVPHIVDNDEIMNVFQYCVDCIVDPCQQFSIKLIVEWTIVSLCLRFITLFEEIISEEFEKSLAEKRIGSISSWINILTLVARTDSELSAKCLDRIVGWTSAQNFPVRCTAIAACRLIYNQLEIKDRRKYRIVKSIVEFCAEPSGNSKRVIDNLCNDFYFAKLLPEEHFDMQTVFKEIPSKTGMPPEETIPESIIDKLNTTRVMSFNDDEDFLYAPSEVYSALSKNTSSAPDMTVDPIVDDDSTTETDTEATSFQRKIVKDVSKKNDGSSLIVVASLVDKPNNLGGICRTSEIFGVDTLVVSDVLVAQDSNFRALSMSSENWQKIEGVRPQNLLAYLESLRMKGYTVIAAEQTTDSVMMHEFVFPKKSVIVMGDEKEGVPVNLLRAVDKTVEIKQLGHTRSLNVHVTAALLIAKYAEQVRFSAQ